MVCKKCGCEGIWKQERKGNNEVAYCGRCGAYIQNISYDEPRFYIGKYKGKAIKDIDDLSYLKWAKETLRLNERTRVAVDAQISSLSNLLK